ncbi:hypothetical protein [Planctopirus hydrillae]|uniref:Uncharacterized protein n=1 Tax=Planctopirus hydrillae TaxID=1841610 RepID=A0A1C3EBK8_9PLAN|nr:hypothetical protein [Planctopirus hydrillae]ODA30574.1 hypothetical protein A6X21_05980 [Planctopirus hydrillae]
MSFQRRKVLIRPDDILAQKWSIAVIDEGFTPFPKRLLRCLDRIFGESQGVNELRVILTLVDYRRPNLTRDPSLDYLAFVSGLSKDKFLQIMCNLREQNLIEFRGSDAAIHYDLTRFMEKVESLTNDDGTA